MSILKTIKKRVLVFVVGWAAGILVRLIRRTLHFEVQGREHLEAALARKRGVILVFWHGGMLIPMMVHIGTDIAVLVSGHADGEIVARVLHNLRYQLIRGSATRGGRHAMKEMSARLRDNRILAITPDGPSGPYHECKEGLAILAARTGAPIIPMVSAASHFTVLRSWDRFQFVLPWTYCILRYGAPLTIASITQPDLLRNAVRDIENTLEALANEVQEELGVKPSGMTVFTREKVKGNTFTEKVLDTASNLYKGIMIFRNRLYDESLLKEHILPIPVISVGNITLGGTGKTPMTIMLAKFLRDKGLKPAVISRGYGRRSRGIRVVSDGMVKLVDWRNSGDEPALMAHHLEGVPIIVGSNKYQTGLIARRTFDCNVIILDDGFQHRRLKRNLDILLVNTVHPFGNGKLIPSGNLREPLEALKRASIIVAAKGEKLSDEDFAIIQENSKAPVFRAGYISPKLVRWDGEDRMPLKECRGANVVAFAGLADPDPFFAMLAKAGMTLCRTEYFADHYPYSNRDWRNLTAIWKRTKADLLVTTEKDRVRIDEALIQDCPLYYLEVDWEIQEKRDEFFKAVMDAASS